MTMMVQTSTDEVPELLDASNTGGPTASTASTSGGMGCTGS